MNAKELLERLRTLSKAGALTDTALYAPLLPGLASDAVVFQNSDDIPDSMRKAGDGPVTLQDLEEFIEWVDAINSMTRPV